MPTFLVTLTLLLSSISLHAISVNHGLQYLQTGLMDDGVKLTLLASWMTLFVIFAARKFTQPIKVDFYFWGFVFIEVYIFCSCTKFADHGLWFNFKDDIGDKSVFMFNSLRDDERKTLLEKLEQQRTRN